MVLCSVQSLSCIESLQPHGCQASLSITNYQSLLKLMSIELVVPSNHLILCRPLLLQSFPASEPFSVSQFFASGGRSIGVSASASVLPMNIKDWFPLGLTGLIALQSKGLLQHHSSKALILRRSAFFIAQLSHPYMTAATAAKSRQSCPTLCDPTNRSTPGLPVHYQLLDFTQTRVHWVGDAIQPSHPLSSPSPPAFNLSQHQWTCDGKYTSFSGK